MSKHTLNFDSKTPGYNAIAIKFVKIALNLLNIMGQLLLSEFIHTYSNKIKLQ
jgi:hypothetical protein